MPFSVWQDAYGVGDASVGGAEHRALVGLPQEAGLPWGCQRDEHSGECMGTGCLRERESMEQCAPLVGCTENSFAPLHLVPSSHGWISPLQSAFLTAQVDPTGSHVTALLDFGDLSETYAVAEVAIALTYTLLSAMRLHEQSGKAPSDGIGCADSGDASSDIRACGSDDGGLETAFEAGKLLLVSVPTIPVFPPRTSSPPGRTAACFSAVSTAPRIICSGYPPSPALHAGWVPRGPSSEPRRADGTSAARGGSALLEPGQGGRERPHRPGQCRLPAEDTEARVECLGRATRSGAARMLGPVGGIGSSATAAGPADRDRISPRTCSVIGDRAASHNYIS